MARILLVEDNPQNQHLFMTTLTHHGHDVTLAQDGEEALELIAKVAPDLVVLDLSLPRVDGWTVARRLREHDQENIRGVKVLALTAHAMRGDRERALAAGCDDYLSKPVSPRELARRVLELTASKEAA